MKAVGPKKKFGNIETCKICNRKASQGIKREQMEHVLAHLVEAGLVRETMRK